MSFRYDVFFSYRHKPLDAVITQKAFNLIESYRLPGALHDKGYEEVRRAFRDTEELPVSRILTDTIDQALHSTRCLIVVCSTDTPSSEWIDREVEKFIELGRADYIYPLLITGDPEQSFPPSLKLVPDIQSRVMDIRTPGNQIKKMMAKAQIELLRAISGVAGCSERELVREHKLRRNRRLALRVGSGLAAFAAVAFVSLGLMNLAQSYRETAQKQEAASMRILSELTYSLPDHLTNVPGAYSRIAGILQRNTEDINAVLRLSTDRTAAETEAAANYQKLANAGAVLGRYGDALSAQQTAIEHYEELVSQGVDGSGENLASAYNNLGNLLNASGRYDEAASAYHSAIDQQRTSGENPLRLAEFYLNAGANAVNLGSSEEAAEYFDAGIRLLDFIGEDPDSIDVAARIHLNYGVMLYRGGSLSDAEDHLRTACARYEELTGMIDSLQNRAQSVQAESMLAAVLSDSGKFSEADRCYERAITAAEELAQDKENLVYQRSLAQLCNNRAMSYNMHGDYLPADGFFSRAAGLYKEIADRTGAASDRAMAALTLLNLGENAFKLPDYSRSKECFESGLSVYESVLDQLGTFDTAQYRAWLSYYQLIHCREPYEAFQSALSACELQPDNIFNNLILGYACLYSGYYEDADTIFTAVASLGEGQVEVILGDLAAQQAAGLSSEHIPALIDKLNSLHF